MLFHYKHVLVCEMSILVISLSIYIHRHTHTHIYTIIYIHTYMYAFLCMYVYTIYICNTCLKHIHRNTFSNKKEQNTITYCNRDEPQKCNAKCKGQIQQTTYCMVYQFNALNCERSRWLVAWGWESQLV